MQKRRRRRLRRVRSPRRGVCRSHRFLSPRRGSSFPPFLRAPTHVDSWAHSDLFPDSVARAAPRRNPRPAVEARWRAALPQKGVREVQPRRKVIHRLLRATMPAWLAAVRAQSLARLLRALVGPGLASRLGLVPFATPAHPLLRTGSISFAFRLTRPLLGARHMNMVMIVPSAYRHMSHGLSVGFSPACHKRADRGVATKIWARKAYALR